MNEQLFTLFIKILSDTSISEQGVYKVPYFPSTRVEEEHQVYGEEIIRKKMRKEGFG